MRMLGRMLGVAALVLTLNATAAAATDTLPGTDPEGMRYAQLQLRQVLLLSRSNLTVPNTTSPVPRDLTPHRWYEWHGAPGELTTRGAVLENLMGQYFHQYIASEHLLDDMLSPSVNDVLFYADSVQASVISARQFLTGMLPAADLSVYQRFTAPALDSTFASLMLKYSVNIKQEAMKQVAAMHERGIEKLQQTFDEPLRLLADTMNMGESPACAGPDHYCKFDTVDLDLRLKHDEPPTLEGSLVDASKAAHALLAQYYELGPEQAAFGHQLTTEEWQQIGSIGQMENKVLSTPPPVAVLTAYPLLSFIREELRTDLRRFTYLAGHRRNLAAVGAMLGIDESEPLTDALEILLPPGCKLMLRKWRDPKGHFFVDLNLVYFSTSQMRELQLMDLSHPPRMRQLYLKNLQHDYPEGLYPLEDVLDLMAASMRMLDQLK